MNAFPPKISIITPALNVGNCIEKSLLSVGNQSYKNIEHIIIDGASMDGTISVVRNYQKNFSHIQLLSEKDSGVYDAMNKGMVVCSGDWIYFLGADDQFYHDNILLELFSEGLFSEEQVVYGNVIVKGDAGWAKDNQIYDGPFDLTKLFRGNICHQSIFYPRSVIARVGFFNERYYVTADWDYNIHCWAKYNFRYTDKIIAFFQAGGVSSKGGDKALAIDKPGNIIRYFNLDPLDPKYSKPDSPFHYMVSLFLKNEKLKNSG